MSKKIEHLSERHLTILRMAAEGKTMKETAELLKLQGRSVQQYLDDVKEYSGALNTCHAVALFITRGIISIPA